MTGWCGVKTEPFNNAHRFPVPVQRSFNFSRLAEKNYDGELEEVGERGQIREMMVFVVSDSAQQAFVKEALSWGCLRLMPFWTLMLMGRPLFGFGLSLIYKLLMTLGWSVAQ